MFRKVLALAVLLAAPAWAAEPDPVETALEACLARPGAATTAAMASCTDAAIRAYDKRLNETYQRAMMGLDAKSQELLRAAQRAWLAFRTAERAAMRGPFAADRGTMMQLEVLAAEKEAIRNRAAELKLYLADPD